MTSADAADSAPRNGGGRTRVLLFREEVIEVPVGRIDNITATSGAGDAGGPARGATD